MVSIPLFVLLLATYAYSVPIGVNDNFSKSNVEFTSSKPMIMHLVDDGEFTSVPTTGRINLTTDRDALRVTTPRLFLNNDRVPREMLESSTLFPTTVESSSESEFHPRGIEESSTLFPTTVESSSQSEFHPRGLKESSTLFPTTVESSSESEFHPRGIEESSTLFPTTVESSSQSEFRPRGVEQSSTLFPSFVETSTQFNQRRILGQNVQSTMDLQTTEEPLSSSVSSFAQTTGLLRTQRGEHEEEHESTSITTDEATTEFSSTGRLNTVIEVIPGRNTKTEVIPGRNTKTEIITSRNTKTEIIPGLNTKTEIITNGSYRSDAGHRVLSEGKN